MQLFLLQLLESAAVRRVLPGSFTAAGRYEVAAVKCTSVVIYEISDADSLVPVLTYAACAGIREATVMTLAKGGEALSVLLLMLDSGNIEFLSYSAHAGQLQPICEIPIGYPGNRADGPGAFLLLSPDNKCLVAGSLIHSLSCVSLAVEVTGARVTIHYKAPVRHCFAGCVTAMAAALDPFASPRFIALRADVDDRRPVKRLTTLELDGAANEVRVVSETPVPQSADSLLPGPGPTFVLCEGRIVVCSAGSVWELAFPVHEGREQETGNTLVVSHSALRSGSSTFIFVLTEHGDVYRLDPDGEAMYYYGNAGADYDTLALQRPADIVLFGRAGAKVLGLQKTEGGVYIVSRRPLDTGSPPVIAPVPITALPGAEPCRTLARGDAVRMGEDQTQDLLVECWRGMGVPYPITGIDTVHTGAVRNHILVTHPRGATLLQRGIPTEEIGRLQLSGCAGCRLFAIGYYTPSPGAPADGPVLDSEGGVAGDFQQYILVSVPPQHKTLVIACGTRVEPLDSGHGFVTGEETLFACHMYACYLQVTPSSIVAVSHGLGVLGTYHPPARFALAAALPGHVYCVTEPMHLVHFAVAPGVFVPQPVSSAELPVAVCAMAVCGGAVVLGSRDGRLLVYGEEGGDLALQRSIPVPDVYKCGAEREVASVEAADGLVAVCLASGVVLRYALGDGLELAPGQPQLAGFNPHFAAGRGKLLLSSSVPAVGTPERLVPIAIPPTDGITEVTAVNAHPSAMHIAAVVHAAEGTGLVFYRCQPGADAGGHCAAPVSEYRTEGTVRRLARLPAGRDESQLFALLETGGSRPDALVLLAARGRELVAQGRLPLEPGAAALDVVAVVPQRRKERPYVAVTLRAGDAYALRTYGLEDGGSLVPRHTAALAEEPTALCANGWHVVVGGRTSLVALRDTGATLAPVARYDGLAAPVVRLSAWRERVCAGLQGRGASLFVLRAAAGVLTPEVDTAFPVHTCAVHMLDGATVCVGSKLGTLSVLRMPSAARELLGREDGGMPPERRSELLRKCGFAGDAVQARARFVFDRLCFADIRDVPCAFAVDALAPGQPPAIVLGTATGAVLALVPFADGALVTGQTRTPLGAWRGIDTDATAPPFAQLVRDAAW